MIISLKKQYRDTPLKGIIIPTFCLKIFAGIAYGWVYVIYYEGIGDSLNYFRDAGILAQIAYQNPKQYLEIIFLHKYYPISNFSTGDLWLQPRAFIIIKLISFFSLITGQNYWLIGFYFSFFSFWGMWSLTHALSTYFPKTSKAAVVSFLLLPSVVFWSAGLSKESLVMSIICFGVARIVPYLQDSSRFKKRWITDLSIWSIVIIVLWLVKFYYLAALLPCVASFFISRFLVNKLKNKAPLVNTFPLNFVILLFVLITILFLGTLIVPGQDIKSVMINIVSNHNVTYIFSQPDDLIHYTIIPPRGYITLSPNWSSFIYNSPQALFSSLFRPFLWETGGNKLKILLSLESFIILLLSIYALIVYLFQSIVKKSIQPETHLLIWSTILYISILNILLAFASPNFGSLVRYKVATLPFLAYLISINLFQKLEIIILKIFQGAKKIFF